MVIITVRARHTRMLAATLYLCDYSLQYVNVWHLFELFLIICSWYTVQEFAVSLFSLLSFLLKKERKKKTSFFFFSVQPILAWSSLCISGWPPVSTAKVLELTTVPPCRHTNPDGENKSDFEVLNTRQAPAQRSPGLNRGPAMTPTLYNLLVFTLVRQKVRTLAPTWRWSWTFFPSFPEFWGDRGQSWGHTL